MIKKLRFLLSIIFLSISAGLLAQPVNGPSSGSTGFNYTYTHTATLEYPDPIWEAINGVIISESQNNLTYTAIVQWTAAGTGTIRIRSGVIKGTKNVTVTASPTPLPSTTFTYTYNCGSTVVTRNSNPPAGVDWYWQTSSRGTDVTISNGASITQTTSGTIYLRAKGTTYWSTNSVSVPVTVYTNPATAPVSSTNGVGFRDGQVSISVSPVSGATNYKWYLQPTGGTAVATTAGPNYVAPSVPNNTTYYASALIGCESPTRRSVVASVVEKPQIGVVGGGAPTISKNKKISLNTTLPFDAYIWKNSSNATIGTAATVEITTPGKYKVEVTKAGIYGAGLSAEFEVYQGIAGQNRNYIVVNSMLSGTRDTTKIDKLPVDSVLQAVKYFDGLGRAIQSVVTQGSPNKRDMVMPTSYDKYGRETIKYLPYVPGETSGWFKSYPVGTSGYAGSAHQQFYAATNDSVTNDQSPFSETIFDYSPLNKIMKQGSPGAVWQPVADPQLDKSAEFQYGANVANDVIKWKYIPTNGAVNHYITSITAGGTFPDHYPAGELHVRKTIDEENHLVIEYMDKQMRMVLKRVEYAANKYANTYYIFDEDGNLSTVLPPEAVTKLSAEYFSVSTTLKNAFLSQWAFRYKYDKRKRMAEKQTPGTDPVYMVYDNRDRLVLTQDGNQRKDAAGTLNRREWIFIKYDTLNRVVVTGRYVHGSVVDQQQMSALVSTTKFAERFIGSGAHGYTSDVFPKSNLTIHIVNYYDDYRFRKLISDSVNYFYDSAGVSLAAKSKFVRGQLTGTKLNVLGSVNYLWSARYFDEKYQVVQTVIQNYKGGRDREYIVYDFAGRITESKVAHNVTGSSYTRIKKVDYDHAGRVMKIWHKIDSEPFVLLTQNKYNALGQLITKSLHSRNSGATFNQYVDHQYQIRGWLTKINSPGTIATTDLFSEELRYDTINAKGSPRKFNGNISEMIWTTVGSGRQLYSYYYDSLERIKEGRYYDLGKPQNDRTFDEIIGGVNVKGYDLNGNILKVSRKGEKHLLPPGVIDDLKYDYVGNQLKIVNDQIADNTNEQGFKELTEKTFSVSNNNAQNEYAYDWAGNLTKDDNKGITAIKYNHLNLVRTVIKNGADSIAYRYDASGRKISQQVYGSAARTTDYINEFIYENNTLQFILHEDGRVVPDNSPGAVRPWEYQYFLKDHLGSIRVVFSEKTSSAQVKADLETSPNSNFDNSTTNRSGFTLGNHTPSGTYSQLLNGGTSGQVGLAKSIAVNPGDVVDVEVYAKYEGPLTTGNDVNALATSLITAFGLGSGAHGPIDGSQAQTTFSSFFSTPYVGRSGGPALEDAVAPKAYLNYILFDENFNFVDFGFDQIDADAKQVGAAPVVPHDYLSLHVKVQQKGFLYVYISNEQPVRTNVYFDDMRVTISTAIQQTQDYYPFGLAYNSYQRGTTFVNSYLFNGIERQDELNLGWDLAQFRSYDPTLTRWLQIDPKSSERESPYIGFANNPILFSDPLGDTIRVSGSKEFLEQYQKDRQKIAETKEGRELLKYLDEHKSDVNITEANSLVGSIKDFFEEGSGDADHVFESKSVEGFSRKGWHVDVEYSQIEGVQVDDSKSQSYTTLGHELMHAKSFLDGSYFEDLKTMDPNDARMKNETKAVEFENTLRAANGDQNYRTKYGSQTVVLLIYMPNGTTKK